MEQFNPCLRNFVAMGKNYEKALASKSFFFSFIFSMLPVCCRFRHTAKPALTLHSVFLLLSPCIYLPFFLSFCLAKIDNISICQMGRPYHALHSLWHGLSSRVDEVRIALCQQSNSQRKTYGYTVCLSRSLCSFPLTHTITNSGLGVGRRQTGRDSLSH